MPPKFAEIGDQASPTQCEGLADVFQHPMLGHAFQPDKAARR